MSATDAGPVVEAVTREQAERVIQHGLGVDALLNWQRRAQYWSDQTASARVEIARLRELLYHEHVRAVSEFGTEGHEKDLERREFGRRRDCEVCILLGASA